MAWPVTDTRKACELVMLEGKIRNLVLTLRYLLDKEIEMSVRQLDIKVGVPNQGLGRYLFES